MHRGQDRRRKAKAAAPEPGIVIKPWNPDTPYLKELQRGQGQGRAVCRLHEEPGEVTATRPPSSSTAPTSSASAGDAELALQVLSNIAELELEDATLLRVLAHRLEQIGQLDLAVQSFERGARTCGPRSPSPTATWPWRSAQRAEQATKDAHADRPADGSARTTPGPSTCWSAS